MFLLPEAQIFVDKPTVQKLLRSLENSKQLCLYVCWIEDEVHEENLLSFPPAIDNSSSPVLASLCPPERDKGEKKAVHRYNKIWVSFSLDVE